METLQEVAHAKTWCGQVQLARWGQIIFKVASKKKREDTYYIYTFDFNIYFVNQNFRKYFVKYYIFW